MVREVRVPDRRAPSASAARRASPDAPDEALDVAASAFPASRPAAITVTSSQHLPGGRRRAGSSAIDGDPTTVWSDGVRRSVGSGVDVQTAEPVTFDHLDLQVVADGQHSVPTQLDDAGGESRGVDVPGGGRRRRGSASAPAVRVPFRGS